MRFPLVAAEMPQAATPEASAEDHAPKLAAGAQTRRILVIDDNVDAAESLQVLLGVFGHRVEIAHEGVTALQVVWTFKPELVFLDIGLPGMNGYEVARRIRDEIGMKSVRLIALSGYGAESDQTRSREAGFVRHLVKPVDPSALPNIISEVFAD